MSAPSRLPSAGAWAVYLVLPLVVMAYTLWRSPLYWLIPPDPTNWDAAQFALHGHVDKIYSTTTGLVSFPGLVVLSLPVAAASNLFHLGSLTTGSGHSLRPTAWYLWGPWVSLVAGSVILAADSVAGQLRITRGRRLILAIVEAALVWQLIVLWGHPEDALAVAAFLWAWLASEHHQWTGAGWLMGVAIAVQPVVLLVLPILWVRCPAGRRSGFLIRSAVISVVVLAPELLTSFHATFASLVRQPNYPTLDHATPLLWLAPRLAPVGGVETVAAGPARLASLALCCLVAYGVYRWHPAPDRLVWCFALCFALRSLLESVMDPYYVWSALAVAVLVAATRQGLYFVLAAVTAILVTGYAQTDHSPWVWWGPLIVGTALVLWAGFPRAGSQPAAGSPIDDRSGATLPAT